MDLYAKAFGVSPYDLFEESDVRVTAEERELLERLRHVGAEGRKVILMTVRNMAPTIPEGDHLEDDPDSADD